MRVGPREKPARIRPSSVLAATALALGSALLCAASLSAACVDNPPAEGPPLDPHFYRCEVQPVFDQGCAALACHGDPARPFHVFTRGRERLEGDNLHRDLPTSAEELDAGYQSARAFALAHEATPEATWLLLKPLDTEAGGYFHLGKELFGGEDVWTSPEDPGYQVVLQWLHGATADPGCLYPGTL